MIVAQVDKVTREVKAVVDMRPPLAAPPANLLFVTIASFDDAKAYYVNGAFQDQNPNE